MTFNANTTIHQPSAAIRPLSDPDAIRVWNYWFAARDLSGARGPVVDPFADDYTLNQRLWFRGGPEVDAEIRGQFAELVARAGRGELDGWRDSPRECLALVLLLDQFPRHIHRGTALAFAHDARALAIADEALARGLDRELAPAESLFLFLVLTHSEVLADVRRALAGIDELTTRCTRAQQRIAKSWHTGTQKHIDVLERFGRYPHRNAALGRASTPAEQAFLDRPEFTALFMRSQTPQGTAAPAPVHAPERASTPAPTGRRLKILALHGFRQNGDVFRARIRKLREALADIAELTFVTSPHRYSPQGETRAATLAAFGEIPQYPTQRVWWMSSEDNEVYEGFDDSVAYLESVFRAHGPFDGVVGFAQGGTLAAVLAAMLPHPAIAFRFAICISAFPSRATAHASYMRPGGIKVPALHVLGANDILVTPDRSIALFETFDPAVATLVQHAGGHFVPGAWPYAEIRRFARQFMADDSGEAAPNDAADQAANDLPAVAPGSSLLDLVCEALSSAPVDVSLVHSVLHEMAEQGRWRELQSAAVYAHSRRGEADRERPEESALQVVHEEIVDLFVQRLKADLTAVLGKIGRRHGVAATERTSRLVQMLETHGVLAGGQAEDSERWPSTCAREAPRVGARPDKLCRIAKDIACALFQREAMHEFIATREREAAARVAAGEPLPPKSATTATRRRHRQNLDLEAQARHLAYQRYGQQLSLIVGALAEMDPNHARELLRRQKAAREYSPDTLAARRTLPISRQVVEPEPEPVVPCTLAELSPLLSHLRDNLGVERQTAFSKGTLTTDGRLDLCKQVVGPAGIRPLLAAMKFSDRVKRLLLGNNIVGDGGAAAIAEFIREREDSPLDCWYIAGNHIGPEGIAHVCDALAHDTRVTSLWLKRNPLKAAGMVPLARLLRENTTIEVLDLVNCGLLDDGLEILLDALSGPGANRTLRHLYVGTNGITERSAPRIAAFLARDCALESFYLSCNRLGDDGVAAIARGLANNHTLRRISLASNCIGPRGAATLAEALARHPSIALLDLGFTKATVAVGEIGNFIGDEGARSLAHMLKTNTTLRSLDLLHNHISQLGVNFIREAMKVNRTLVTLQLTQFGKVHNEPGKEELRAALQRNRALVPHEETDAVTKIDLPDHITEIYSVYRTHS